MESALIEHHAVAEAAVVSSPDPVRGEVSRVFMVKPGEENLNGLTGKKPG